MAVIPRADYPSDRDAEWVAVDRTGQVAVLTTGGAGPMPVAYWADPTTLEAITAAISALPVITTAVPAPWTVYAAPAEFIPKPLPDSWADFAARGCFVYDWSDVHRTRDRLGQYELMARPAVPRRYAAADWPLILQPLLATMHSTQLAFGARTLDVTPLAVNIGVPARD